MKSFLKYSYKTSTLFLFFYSSAIHYSFLFALQHGRIKVSEIHKIEKILKPNSSIFGYVMNTVARVQSHQLAGTLQVHSGSASGRVSHESGSQGDQQQDHQSGVVSFLPPGSHYVHSQPGRLHGVRETHPHVPTGLLPRLPREYSTLIGRDCVCFLIG